MIRFLDSSKAHGCDSLSASMIKICYLSVVEPLCQIFGKCLETGIYPLTWKKANIVPTHRKVVGSLKLIIGQFYFYRFSTSFLKS